MLKITLNEQAEKLPKYALKASFLDEDIFCHCSYFLVYNRPQTDNHWRQELFGFVKTLKVPILKSGSKLEATEESLVVDNHGEHFCEDRLNATAVLARVYDSEEIPHPFDFNMDIQRNRDVYFDALDKFYYDFLIPWISEPNKNPSREELYMSVDSYLIARREDMLCH